MVEAVVPAIRTVQVIRYVTPLREGGSLPAIVEADDLGTYVLKFRGAGQGIKVLIAELLAAELARVLALPVPEVVFAELDAVLARSEPDSEIKALIEASAGLNLGMDYLPGSLGYSARKSTPPDPEVASAIVWFDAFLSNVDRTPRNPNLLLWHRQLWMIDHGAAMYFHFAGADYVARAGGRFPEIKQHIFLPAASQLREVDAQLTARLTLTVIQAVVALIPDAWLDDDRFPGPEAQRAAYVAYLQARLEQPHAFLEEAIDARAQLV